MKKSILCRHTREGGYPVQKAASAAIWLVYLFAFAFLLSGSPINAQETPPPANPEAVKQLITTLESETARTEFISNLKLLLTQQDEKKTEEETITPLTQTLGVESFTDKLLVYYQDFLAKNGLTGSTLGKAALSIGALIIMLPLTFFVRKGITRGLMGLDTLFVKLNLRPMRLRFYGRFLRSIVTFVIIGLLIYTGFTIWAPKDYNPFEYDWFKILLKSIFNIGFVVFIAAFLWEVANAIIQSIFNKISGSESARTQTVMPIIRNILFIVFSLFFTLILLSEIGINIMPLLAGAGIVGVAIGFGAQSMVKDFLTGFTIIMEDVIRVGDVVRLAGHAGTVEKITLRKVQLRDFNGRVFTIPFSDITTIENLTKDFSYYPMDISVSYAADTDHVCNVLREVDSELRADPLFGGDMLEPIDIHGVDAFADSAVIIKARLKTQPLQQWRIGREFNRRMKKAFNAAGIEIPFPQRVITIKNESV